MKLLFYDLETTGVRYWKNGIHQISGEIVIDGESKEKFNFFVKPHESCLIEEEALAVCNVTSEQIKAYPPMNEVYLELTNLLAKYIDKFDKKDKFFLVGYNNSSFDNAFFKAFFVQNNDNYFYSWFWVNSIDVMVLSTLFLMDKRASMRNFKQETVARELGIELDSTKLHDAHYDVWLTKIIYDKIIENSAIKRTLF